MGLSSILARATSEPQSWRTQRWFVLFLLLHLTGSYGIRWAVCAVPALRVGVKELVTICTSTIAIHNPVPIAKTPIQSRNRAASSGGLAADGAAAAAGRAGAVPGTCRRASANRPSLPRRNVSTKVIGGVR